MEDDVVISEAEEICFEDKENVKQANNQNFTLDSAPNNPLDPSRDTEQTKPLRKGRKSGVITSLPVAQGQHVESEIFLLENHVDPQSSPSARSTPSQPEIDVADSSDLHQTTPDPDWNGHLHNEMKLELIVPSPSDRNSPAPCIAAAVTTEPGKLGSAYILSAK